MEPRGQTSAPFSKKQLRNIRAYLREMSDHFGCPNHSRHVHLVAQTHGLVCPVCDFVEPMVAERIASGIALQTWQGHVRALSSVTQDTRGLSL